MVYNITKEKDGVRLTAAVLPMGEDLLVSVSGGDAPHIGCAALATLRESLSDPGRQSATVSTLNVVGHKDDAVANRMVLRIAAALGVQVAAVCGIHVNCIADAGHRSCAGDRQ